MQPPEQCVSISRPRSEALRKRTTHIANEVGGAAKAGFSD